MIAPLRQIDPEMTRRRRRLRHAYRVVASTFLPESSQPADNPPPVSAWRAWVFAGWVAIVTVVYFVTMLT